MSIPWKGYEFNQDEDILKIYCKYKGYSLLRFKRGCIGYGKKFWRNQYIFIRLNFPQCTHSELENILQSLYKKTIALKILSSTKIPNIKEYKLGYTMVIDLEKTENELWKSLNKKKRNAIRRGYKKGVKVSLLKKKDRLEEWIRVYESTVKRKKFSGLPKGYLRELFDLKNTYFFYSAVDNDIAAIALIVRENSNIYWRLGGTNMRYANYQPNDVLHWEIIKWGIENNFNYYDMAGIVRERKDGPTHFKLRFNGKIIPYYIYIFYRTPVGKIFKNLFWRDRHG